MSQMAEYQRKTVLAPGDILNKADELLPEWIGVNRSKASPHGATFSGEEGTVTLSIHRHGPYTDVLATTDRFRTSRMDYEIRKFLTELPYEEGDRGSSESEESS